jgi:endonuclease/exonuclease/phosphatase family metal-dependent hydrolase
MRQREARDDSLTTGRATASAAVARGSRRAAIVLGLSLVATTAAAEVARVRFAQFNIFELSRKKVDEVDAQGRGTNAQLEKAASIVQLIRPDVLLVNEIDGDGGETARLFLERYLAVGQDGQDGVRYPHVFAAPSNTGQPSGLDLNNNGRTTDPEDAFGFGRYPGEFGMALYSVHPIDTQSARTLQTLLWKDMPGHLIPDGRGGRPEWYSPDAVAALRLSSKSHWDVPVVIGRARVHVVCAHPTPPVFDGPEDRNGRRNFDEIRLLADYVRGGEAAAYIVDDRGARGGLGADALFVVMGDMNADPARDEAPYGRRAMDQMLAAPRVQDAVPTSLGGLASESSGPPRFLEKRTTEFGRVDYVLPSRGLTVLGSGVFWPPAGDPLRALVDEPSAASDHRLVWVDVAVP